MTRIVGWFSAGAASAVACKLLLSQRKPGAEIIIARIALPEDEHPDNERFAADCEVWFGQPIVTLRNAEYTGCLDVFRRRRYMSGVAGAICTTELKRAVRHEFERDWQPDAQVFGFTVEEAGRAKRFRENSPDVRLVTPLIEAGLGKSDCLGMLDRAGIRLPVMYRLGFANNNCVGCVKAQSPGYWSLVRHYFPSRFAELAALSREIGARLLRVGGARLFLDELPADAPMLDDSPAADCGLLCAIAEQQIAEATHA